MEIQGLDIPIGFTFAVIKHSPTERKGTLLAGG